MASLSRAYGVRGAAIALGVAAVAGMVHGSMAAGFDFLAVKIAVGLAGSVIMIISGAVSARQGILSAVAVGLSMGIIFFVMRWSAWAMITGGPSELATFLTTLPWGWPAYLEAAGISGYWTVEAVSMCVPALIGCIAGHERPEIGPSSAQSSS